MAKEFSKAFYSSKAWQMCREAALMRDKYLCVKCGSPASDVHHIIHITRENVNDPSVTLNQENLISLCKDCHNREHHAAEAQIFDDNGYLIG